MFGAGKVAMWMRKLTLVEKNSTISSVRRNYPKHKRPLARMYLSLIEPVDLISASRTLPISSSPSSGSLPDAGLGLIGRNWTTGDVERSRNFGLLRLNPYRKINFKNRPKRWKRQNKQISICCLQERVCSKHKKSPFCPPSILNRLVSPNKGRQLPAAFGQLITVKLTRLRFFSQRGTCRFCLDPVKLVLYFLGTPTCNASNHKKA